MSGTDSQPRVPFLGILAIAGVVILLLVMFFLLQAFIAPRLLAGTLSQAIVQPCNAGKQWVLYDCKPNALTRLGCIVPGSNGKYLTYKTVAVQNPTCLPNSQGEEAGERVISDRWQLIPEINTCTSTTTPPLCCNYDSTCTLTARYFCQRTNQTNIGENQCTPYYLPAPFPGYDPSVEYTEANPAVIHVPCRKDFCGTS